MNCSKALFLSLAEITYDELCKNFNDVTVIDVRNRNEMQSCGQIPGSHCIPGEFSLLFSSTTLLKCTATPPFLASLQGLNLKE